MNESLYFKNGKPRKHPKKIKAVIVDEPLPIVKEADKTVDKNNLIIKKQKDDENYNKTYKNLQEQEELNNYFKENLSQIKT